MEIISLESVSFRQAPGFTISGRDVYKRQLGFPVITNETENIFREPKSLIVQEDVSKFNATSLEARDIKIKITNIDIPVAFASAFEGEICLLYTSGLQQE